MILGLVLVFVISPLSNYSFDSVNLWLPCGPFAPFVPGSPGIPFVPCPPSAPVCPTAPKKLYHF